MKSARPSVYDRRLEAILEKYRDKERRPGGRARALAALMAGIRPPHAPAPGCSPGCCSLLINLQPFVWPYMVKIVVDTILCVQQHGIDAAHLAQHDHWVLICFSPTAAFIPLVSACLLAVQL